MRYISILIFLFAGRLCGQVNASRIDSLINRIENNNLGAGGLCITQGGKVEYERPFGQGQTTETEYRIGSVTKMFTAVLIYQLVDEGRLSLGDKLSRFFPDLPNADKITIADLLGHSSGLANFTGNTDFDLWKDLPQTSQALLDRIRKQPVDFAPGARKDYNNSNYLLLGYILEKIYHKQYKEVLKENLIAPLGLKHTYYGDHSGFAGNETPSFKYANGQWQQERAVYLPNFDGAGAVISAPQDMCTFITALFTGKLISKSMLDTMGHITDGYGKGLFSYGAAPHPGLGHNGKTEGFGASLQYYPDAGLAIAYCTNAEVYPKQEILDHIYKACFNIADTLPSFDSIVIRPEILKAYTGKYAAKGMEITSTLNQGTLALTLKGQEFSLCPIARRMFWNKLFGFFFEFSEDGHQLRVQDVDAVYDFTKR